MALNKNCARINSPALENEPNKYASCYNPVLNTFIVREAVLSPSSQESRSERHVSGRCQVHRVAAGPLAPSYGLIGKEKWGEEVGKGVLPFGTGLVQEHSGRGKRAGCSEQLLTFPLLHQERAWGHSSGGRSAPAWRNAIKSCPRADDAPQRDWLWG